MSVEKQAGFIEEAWYDGVFSRICDTDGTFLGLYNSGFEITDRRLGQRNSQLIHKIATGPKTPDTSPWQHVLDVCSTFGRDIPLLVLYSVTGSQTIGANATAHLEGSLGIPNHHPALPEHLDLYAGDDGFRPILRMAKAREKSILLDMPDGRLPQFLEEGIEWRGHGDACTHIVVSPLYVAGQLAGFLILGLNPRRPYNEVHRRFAEDVRRVLSGLLEHRISSDQAKAREKQLLKELTQRQKYLQRVAEIATVGICIHSVNGLLTWANARFFELSGARAPGETREYEEAQLLVEEDQEKGIEAFQRCIETRSPCTVELRLQKTWQPPGTDRQEPCWITTTMTPERGEDGEIVEVLGCLTDISRLKWTEKIQTEIAEAAQRAKEQQERFIDTTSHEMRNPLSVILQCADGIITTCHGLEKSCQKERRLQVAFQEVLDNANSIMFCATHQTRIVDDILTVSKLESSMLAINPVIVDARDTIQQVVQMFTAEMALAEINFSLEEQKGFTDLCSTLIMVDPARLTQILINLIGNAIKFTKMAAKHKKIILRVNASSKCPFHNNYSGRIRWFPSARRLAELQEAQESNTLNNNQTIYIMFEVEDNGTGISQEEMTRLFHRFAQATPKTYVTYGGSGLGLFVSRQLVELQGGTIGISSQPGIGSTFAFYIKTCGEFEKVEEHQEESKSERQLSTTRKFTSPTERPKTHDTSNTASGNTEVASPPTNRSFPSVLLVEDNLINQKVLSKQLEKAECRVYKAANGVEALEWIEKSTHWVTNERSNTVEIDVVSMDWEMPVMDGITCTRKIRELEATGHITRRLPIIGATANARSEQIRIALDSGMDDLITKPFTVKDLLKRINEIR